MDEDKTDQTQEESLVRASQEKPKNTYEAFRVESGAVIEGIVRKIVSEEKITPAELQDLQERKIRSLDPDRRDRITSVRGKVAEIDQRFTARTRGMEFRASKMELRSLQSKTYGEAAVAEFAGEARELRQDAEALEADKNELVAIAYQEMWHDAEGGEIVEVDPFTGLKTRDSLMGRISKNVIEWQRTGDDRLLKKIRVKAGDLDNFKQGNDILGHGGFDNLLRDQMAERIKQVAAYTGSTVYQEDLNQAVIDEMFPPGSEERKGLDSLRGVVVVDGYRMKPGADEIFYTYEKVDVDMSEEDFDKHTANADRVVDRLLSSCVIGRYEKAEETSIIKEKFEDSPLALRIRRSDTDNGDFSMVSFEAEYWNGNAEEIHKYLQYSEMGAAIVTNDPPAVLRMSAGMTPARNLDQAVEKFAKGENFTNDKMIDGQSRGGAGMLDGGKTNPTKREEYEESVFASAARRLASVGAGNEVDIQNIIDRAAVDKVDGYFLQILMDEADNKAKPQAKRDLVVNAWTAMPGTQRAGELALQVGSLGVAGRLEKAVASREDRVAVIRSSLEEFSKRAEIELQKLAKLFADKGYTNQYYTTVDGASAVMMAKAIHDAAQAGTLDANILYLYHGLQERSAKYSKDFDQYAYQYTQKGANLTQNRVEMPNPINEGYQNAIRYARYLREKELGMAR